MQAERVSRHYGIAAESNFSLQMFRWANKIIEFVDITKKLEKIGIYELENRMNANKQNRLEIQKLLSKQKLFKRLRTDKVLVMKVEEISHHLS